MFNKYNERAENHLFWNIKYIDFAKCSVTHLLYISILNVDRKTFSIAAAGYDFVSVAF